MANLAFRSAASDGDSSFGSATDIATVPAGAAQNDLEQIWYSSASVAPAAAPTHTTPSGWTAAGTTVANGLAAGALNVRLTMYYRIAPSTPANATLTSSAAAAHAWTRLAHDNPDTAAPFGQVVFGTFTGTSVVASSITTTKANALVGMYVAQGAAQALAPAAGLTERSDNATQGIEFADAIQAAAGASGTKTATAPVSTDGVWGFAEFWSESADVTVGLTGASSTTAVGSMSGSRTVALTGGAGTGSAGSMAPANSKAVTGSSASGAAGTLAPGAAVGLTGASSAAAVGTVSAGSAVTAALTGVSISGQAGSVGPATVKALTGAAATGSAGTLTPTTGVTAALTGVSAAGAAGSVGSARTVAATGAQAAGQAGALAVSLAKVIAGLQSIGSPGALATARTLQLVSATASGDVGTVGVAGMVTYTRAPSGSGFSRAAPNTTRPASASTDRPDDSESSRPEH